MKRAFIILLLSLAAPLYCFAGGDVVIDKDYCTITIHEKTYNLYGDIQIVESYPDLRVQIVDSNPDLKVQIVDHYPGID